MLLTLAAVPAVIIAFNVGMAELVDVDLRRQQGLYLHCICVFHPDVCLTAAQSPWAASVGRTNLTLTFPGWVKLKVRSVPLRDAEKFFRFMETN